MRTQSHASLDVLHEAVRTHLEDYGQAHQGHFLSTWSEPSQSIRVLDMDFYKDDESLFLPPLDLGKVKLRWLSSQLTEIRLIDSRLLKSTHEELLDDWESYLEELPDDQKMPAVEAAREQLLTMHAAVREFLVERLKEDQLLGDRSFMTVHPSSLFVDPLRIDGLRRIRSDKFDLAKIIRLCDELNSCFAAQCFLATGVLVRTLIDHVPPIFEASTFSEAANSAAGKSVKASLKHLEVTSRNIADTILHQQIRSREVLPSATQINFSNDLDVLLSEIMRRLS
jgi:hypothetical protein